MNNKSLRLLAAAAISASCFAAQAADESANPATPPGPAASGAFVVPEAPLSSGQASMANIQNKADYNAKLKMADAQLKRANAACIADTNDSQSACRGVARADANKTKAQAKVTYEQNKADIKTRTQ